MAAHHGGKGDSARPMSVDSRTFSNNFDAIFRKDKTKPRSDRRVDQSKKRGEKK